MKPLQGVKVIDLSRVLAGPFCSMVLADMGADVIKVENPDGGEDSRSLGPFVDGVSAYFASLNRNKRSVTLDLKDPVGKDALIRLLSDADVLLENFRPGTLDRLGFSWSRLQEINPGLICCRISGFGQTGPYRQRPAYDIIVQAMGGIMSITGHPEGIPTRVGSSIGDITAALYSVIGIQAALRVKEQTGKGQEIDISMLDCQLAILENAIARYSTTGKTPGFLGNRHPSAAPFSSIRTSDGFIVVAAGNDGLFIKLCGLLNVPELAKDPRFGSNQDRADHWTGLCEILEEHFTARPSAYWVEYLNDNGFPCGPINDVAQIVADSHIKERGMIKQVEIEGHQLSFAGSPLKFSLTPVDEVYLTPPHLGEHNEEILGVIHNKSDSIG